MTSKSATSFTDVELQMAGKLPPLLSSFIKLIFTSLASLWLHFSVILHYNCSGKCGWRRGFSLSTYGFARSTLCAFHNPWMLVCFLFFPGLWVGCGYCLRQLSLMFSETYCLPVEQSENWSTRAATSDFLISIMYWTKLHWSMWACLGVSWLMTGRRGKLMHLLVIGFFLFKWELKM